MQMCRCAKAESCLCSICVYIIYEFNVWIKRCYCSVCNCAACKSIWKCEKSINLLHHICLYVCKSWVMSLQYMCICCIWAAACMQRRCCHSMYVQALMHWWSRCYCFAFNCVWAQHMSKALLLLCWCWWDCSAFLTSIACRRFVVSILYR